MTELIFLNSAHLSFSAIKLTGMMTKEESFCSRDFACAPNVGLDVNYFLNGFFILPVSIPTEGKAKVGSVWRIPFPSVITGVLTWQWFSVFPISQILTQQETPKDALNNLRFIYQRDITTNVVSSLCGSSGAGLAPCPLNSTNEQRNLSSISNDPPKIALNGGVCSNVVLEVSTVPDTVASSLALSCLEGDPKCLLTCFFARPGQV
jgi:hypothetical protein